MNILKKKMTLAAFVFPKLRIVKTSLDKCLQSPVWEETSTSNTVNVSKRCWNLHRSTFIIFTDHCPRKRLGKTLSYWHEKFWDCVLTHWLPMKSILFIIVKIRRYQFICNFLRNKNLFLGLLLYFWNLD